KEPQFRQILLFSYLLRDKTEYLFLPYGFFLTINAQAKPFAELPGKYTAPVPLHVTYDNQSTFDIGYGTGIIISHTIVI
ncbi:MAG: hypothetical protein K2O12_07205, partial [Muribaculaceae bacterium]|nr:hypothetical protein [Muribaculaceae bacterium]